MSPELLYIRLKMTDLPANSRDLGAAARAVYIRN